MDYNEHMISMMHMSLQNSTTFMEWITAATHESGFDLGPQHRWMHNEMTFLHNVATISSYTYDFVNYMVRYALSRELRHSLLLDNIFDQPTNENDDGLRLKSPNNYNLYLLSFIQNLSRYFYSNNSKIHRMIVENKDEFRALYMYYMVYTAWNANADRSEWNRIANTTGGRIRSQINYLNAYSDRYPPGDVDINEELTKLIERHKALQLDPPQGDGGMYHQQNQVQRQRQHEDDMRHRHGLEHSQNEFRREQDDNIRRQTELDRQHELEREVESRRLLDEETKENQARENEEKRKRELRDAELIRDHEVLEKRAEQSKKDEALAKQLHDSDRPRGDEAARDKDRIKHELEIDQQCKLFRKRLDDIVYPPWRKYIQHIYETHSNWAQQDKKDADIEALIVNQVYLKLNKKATGSGDRYDQDDEGYTVKVSNVKSQDGMHKKQLASNNVSSFISTTT